MRYAVKTKEYIPSSFFGKISPLGRAKLVSALDYLLEEKPFQDITTSEIAKKAGVTDALIYKYFEDKFGLLEEVLSKYMEYFLSQAHMEIKGIKGASNKLRKLIWFHINQCATKRVFAKILMVEIRYWPSYYNTYTYKLVKEYTKLLSEIIKEGINQGELRSGIPAVSIRNFILGGIEHVCFPKVIFKRDISADELTEDLCNIIFDGIRQKEIKGENGIGFS